MRNDIVKNIIFVTSLILAVTWMCAIFGFSANNAEESTMQSNGVTEFLIKVFNPDFDDLSEEEKKEMIESYDGIVRKLAHFCAYALLGFLLCVCICHAPFAANPVYLWPILISVAFATTDEFHQTFVDGRAGRFTDVLIDSAGTVCGVIFVWMTMQVIKKKIRSKRGS